MNSNINFSFYFFVLYIFQKAFNNGKRDLPINYTQGCSENLYYRMGKFFMLKARSRKSPGHYNKHAGKAPNVRARICQQWSSFAEYQFHYSHQNKKRKTLKQFTFKLVFVPFCGCTSEDLMYVVVHQCLSF